MLGIIGAMEVEVKELREMMENPQAQTVAGMTFYQGTIKGKEVVVVRSGGSPCSCEVDDPELCLILIVDVQDIQNCFDNATYSSKQIFAS